MIAVSLSIPCAKIFFQVRLYQWVENALMKSAKSRVASRFLALIPSRSVRIWPVVERFFLKSFWFYKGSFQFLVGCDWAGVYCKFLTLWRLMWGEDISFSPIFVSMISWLYTWLQNINNWSWSLKISVFHTSGGIFIQSSSFSVFHGLEYCAKLIMRKLVKFWKVKFPELFCSLLAFLVYLYRFWHLVLRCWFSFYRISY